MADVSAKMKTRAILCLSFLFYSGVVSSKFGRREFNERDEVGVDRKTSSEQVNAAGEAGFLSDRRARRSFEVGHQKSRANGNGLRSWGTTSTRDASSGTDWGGLFLGIAGSQVCLDTLSRIKGSSASYNVLQTRQTLYFLSPSVNLIFRSGKSS